MEITVPSRNIFTHLNIYCQTYQNIIFIDAAWCYYRYAIATHTNHHVARLHQLLHIKFAASSTAMINLREPMATTNTGKATLQLAYKQIHKSLLAFAIRIGSKNCMRLHPELLPVHSIGGFAVNRKRNC